MTVTIKRSVQIKVTLTADMHARLRQLAEQLGQVPAAVASMAVGEYVRAREVQAGAMHHAMEHAIEKLGPHVLEQVGEQMKLLEAETPSLMERAEKKLREGGKEASLLERARAKGGKQ